MEQKRLMEIRKNKKKKNPKFRRVESWRLIRVKDSWRKSRGIDSQTRMKEKSGVKSPSIGYRGPKKVRGLHPSGYKEVWVSTANDLKKLSNKKHAIKISGKLGTKKRIHLVDYAQNRGFKILNIGISTKELESLESMLKSPLAGLEEEENLDSNDIEDSPDLEE
jgi:large subunit ribosomal protein L32e